MKRELIVVSAIMTVALMCLLAVPTGPVSAGPPPPPPPLIEQKQMLGALQPGWNLIQFMGDVHPSGDYTLPVLKASDLCREAVDGNGVAVAGQLVTMVSAFDQSKQTWSITYLAAIGRTDFTMIGSQSYLIWCASVAGHPFPYGYWTHDNYLSMYQSVPRTGNVQSFPANKYSSIGIYRCGFPPIPPPYGQTTVTTHASDYVNMLLDMYFNPYTGGATLTSFNATSQTWKTYVKGVPGTDFVVNSWTTLYNGWTFLDGLGHGGYGSVGQYYSGLLLWINQPAMLSHAPWWP